MTFYNIIFGILFLGACRQTMLLIDTPFIYAAATVAIVVFNDSLNTSHIFERNTNPPDYRIWLKILDLVGFLILSLALVALNTSDNPFQFTTPAKFADRLNRVTPWPFISAYWVTATIWNHIAEPYADSQRPRLLNRLSLFTHVPLLTMAAWSALKGPPPVALQIGTLTFLIVYFLFLKPLLEKSPAQKALEEKAAGEGAVAVAKAQSAVAAEAASEASASARTAIDAKDAAESAAEKARAERSAAEKAAESAVAARAAVQKPVSDR